MPLTQDTVTDALRTVDDPDLKRDLVSLGMVKRVEVSDDGKRVDLTIELTTPACPLKDKIKSDIEAAVRAKAAEVGGPTDPKISVEFTADVRSPQEKLADKDNPLPGVKHVIAVGAGKGGVGKSTVAVNLAVGLARHGAKVGLLDGDVYGPSAPTMLGLYETQAMMNERQMIMPFEAHGIKSMTIGVLVEREKPLIWRGPMAQGAFKQLLTQTEWGELDYLIVDLPPGTGDVPLSLSQMLPLRGAVIVCTPQTVALDDARRAVRMFQQLGVPLLGVVENMSYFVCEHGTEYDIFGRGGAEVMAQEMNLPYLGGIPITPALREHGDTGDPGANFDEVADAKLATALTKMTQNLAAQVSMASMRNVIAQPTMSIS
ncbi:MAG: Mrp/NBP35 family ATP-binding protein [Phycisphaerales bacterium]